MVLQNYFTYFEFYVGQNQKITMKKTPQKTPPYIYKSNISGLSPLRLLTMIFKSPQFKSKVLIFIQCDFQNYITTSLLFSLGR